MQGSSFVMRRTGYGIQNSTVYKSKIKILCLLVILPLLCLSESLYLGINETRIGYEGLFLLPLSYMFSLVMVGSSIDPSCKWKKGIVYFVAQGVLAFRYLVLPLAVHYTHVHGGWTYYGTDGFGIEPDVESVRVAMLLMYTEVLFAQLSFCFAYKIVLPRLSEKRANKNSNDTDSNSASANDITYLNNVAVLVCFVVIAFLLLAVFQKQLILPKQLFVIDNAYDSDSASASGSFWVVINSAFKFSLLILVYSASGKRYAKSKNRLWILPPAIALLIYLGLSAGVSRWALLIPVFASVSLFYRMFKPFPHCLTAVIIVVMCVGIYSTTYFKYGYLVKGSPNEFIELLGLCLQQSNEYVSGPRSIAQGVATLVNFGDRISLTTFFNSFLSGFAGLASMTNDADKLQSFFNLYCLGTLIDRPLICPICIEGLGFFPVFPWLFLCLFEVLAVVCDDSCMRESRIEWAFLWTVMGCWFALCLAVNTKIIVSQCSGILIPCCLLFFVNERFSIRSRSRSR